MSLENGAPLVVEDLDVTLQYVVFREPKIVERRYVDRLVKNLKQRNIPYVLKERLQKSAWNNRYMIVRTNLTVGDQEVLFEVRDSSNKKR